MFLPRAASHLFIRSREGTTTASGVKLDDHALTAAHRSLPFGSKVRVTNMKNGQSAVVTITDRGPFVAGRVIDLTPAGAHALGFSGLAPVKLEVTERTNKGELKLAKRRGQPRSLSAIPIVGQPNEIIGGLAHGRYHH